MATANPIFKDEELRDARTVVLAEEIKTVRSASRRCADPAQRVALAELEQIIHTTWAQLEQKGEIHPMPEGLTA
jgi:hypothetical protein